MRTIAVVLNRGEPQIPRFARDDNSYFGKIMRKNTWGGESLDAVRMPRP